MDIIVPKGFFGAEDYDSQLDVMLRTIANTASKDSEEEWSQKYGTDFENKVFMMHRFCWCGKWETCPWCTSCSCEHSYFVDDKEVTMEEWVKSYAEMTKSTTFGTPEYGKAGEEANKRRSEKIVKQCELCQTGGIAAPFGGEPGHPAPNFWHKPTGLKVWWYKYIGRSCDLNRPIKQGELEEIQTSCLESLKNE